jgi:hypothetical protein
MSTTSGRHAREFYGMDQNDETAAMHGEKESNPTGPPPPAPIEPPEEP